MLEIRFPALIAAGPARGIPRERGSQVTQVPAESPRGGERRGRPWSQAALRGRGGRLPASGALCSQLPGTRLAGQWGGGSAGQGGEGERAAPARAGLGASRGAAGFHRCPSPQVQTRHIRCLPDVLVINCEVNSSKEADFWKTQAEVGQALRGRRRSFSRPRGLAVRPAPRRCCRWAPAASPALRRSSVRRGRAGAGPRLQREARVWSWKERALRPGQSCRDAAGSLFLPPSPQEHLGSACFPQPRAGGQLGVPGSLCPCH